MAFTPAVFRTSFPEFADIARYPDAMLTFWGDLATMQVNECRWKLMTDKGIMLYVAHEVTMAARNQQTANSSGMPGNFSGPVNSKTVGSVTVAYDTTQGTEKDAGWWNLTIYGKQFIRLARLFGAGTVTV